MTLPNDTVTRDKLRSFIDRYVNLDNEIQERNADKSELLKEAAGDGFDKSAIKAAARRLTMDEKKRDAKEQLDLLCDHYYRVYRGEA